MVAILESKMTRLFQSKYYTKNHGFVMQLNVQISNFFHIRCTISDNFNN